jgi:outer membrane beta-barrel protein
MHRIRTLPILAASLAALISLLPDTAQAKRKSPLEGKPVVVRKLELRKLRVSLTPFVGMSLSQPFVHKGYVGGKLQFDITDWIGIRGMFAYGVLNFDAKLLKGLGTPGSQGSLPIGIPPMTAENPEAIPVRPDDAFNNPAPLAHDFHAGLTRNQFLTSLDIVFTPFSGKLGLFSGIFTEYDLYLFGGLGIAGFQKHYKNAKSTSEQAADAGMAFNTMSPGSAEYCRPGGVATADVNRECFLHPVRADTGVKIGGSFGGGFHVFLADFASINLDVQDILIRNNPAGLNVTTQEVPPVVDKKKDANLNHNVMLTLGVTFYFPPKAKRSVLKPAEKKK